MHANVLKGTLYTLNELLYLNLFRYGECVYYSFGPDYLEHFTAIQNVYLNSTDDLVNFWTVVFEYTGRSLTLWSPEERA